MLSVRPAILHLTSFFLLLNGYIFLLPSFVYMANAQEINASELSKFLNSNSMTLIGNTEKNYLINLSNFKPGAEYGVISSKELELSIENKTDSINRKRKYSEEDNSSADKSSERRSPSLEYTQIKRIRRHANTKEKRDSRLSSLLERFTSSRRSFDIGEKRVKRKNRNSNSDVDSSEESEEYNRMKSIRRKAVLGNNRNLQKSMKNNINRDLENFGACDSLKKCRRSPKIHKSQALKTSKKKGSGKERYNFPPLKSQNQLKKQSDKSGNFLSNKRPSPKKNKLNNIPKVKKGKKKKKKPYYSHKKENFNRYESPKDYLTKSGKQRDLNENILENIDIKKRNPFTIPLNHEIKKRGGKYFWINKNESYENEVIYEDTGKNNTSKTENIQTRKTDSNEYEEHDKNNTSKTENIKTRKTDSNEYEEHHKNQNLKEIVRNKVFHKINPGSSSNANSHSLKNNVSVKSNKPKKALEFHIFNGKSKIVPGKNISHYNNSKHKENSRKQQLSNTKINRNMNLRNIKRERKVGLHANFRPKVFTTYNPHAINETLLKIRRRQLFKDVDRTVRSDDSSMLYKVKDLVGHNFKKQKERRANNASHSMNVNNTKHKDKQLIEEMKDIVVKNFGSDIMKSDFSNMSHFNADDFSFFDEEPKNDLWKMKRINISKRNEKSSPEFETESMTIDEYDEPTTESILKREAGLTTVNNINYLNKEAKTFSVYSPKYDFFYADNMTTDFSNSDVPTSTEISTNSDFTTEKNVNTFPNSVLSKKEIFTSESSKNLAETENFKEKDEASFPEKDDYFYAENTTSFSTTSRDNTPEKSYRDIFETESLDSSSVALTSESTGVTSDKGESTVSPNSSYDESSLALTNDVVSNTEKGTILSNDESSTMSEGYSSTLLENSSSIYTKASKSTVHSTSLKISKSPSRREALDSGDYDYERPVSTLTGSSEDFEEQDYGSFYDNENEEAEASELRNHKKLPESFKGKQKIFYNSVESENNFKPRIRSPSLNEKSSNPNREEKVSLEKVPAEVEDEGVPDEDYKDMVKSSKYNDFSSTKEIKSGKQATEKKLSQRNGQNNMKNDHVDSGDINIKLKINDEYSNGKYYDENKQQNKELINGSELSSVSDFLESSTSIMSKKSRNSNVLAKINNKISSDSLTTLQSGIKVNNSVTPFGHKNVINSKKQTNLENTQSDNKNSFYSQMGGKEKEYNAEEDTELDDGTDATEKISSSSYSVIPVHTSTDNKKSKKSNIKSEENKNEDEKDNSFSSVEKSFGNKIVKNIKPIQNVLEYENDEEALNKKSAISDVSKESKTKSDAHEEETDNSEDFERSYDYENDNSKSNTGETESGTQEQEQEPDYIYEDISTATKTDDNFEKDEGELKNNKQFLLSNTHQNRKINNSENHLPFSEKKNKGQIKSIIHSTEKFRDTISKKESERNTEIDNEDAMESDDDDGVVDDTDSDLNSGASSRDKEISLSQSRKEYVSENKKTENRPTKAFSKMNVLKNNPSKQKQANRNFDKISIVEATDESDFGTNYSKEQIKDKVMEKNAAEETKPIEIRNSLHVQNQAGGGIQKTEYSSTSLNKIETLQNGDDTTKVRDVAFSENDYESEESTAVSEDKYQNPSLDNEEYYDEIANNNNKNIQEDYKDYKNVDENAKIIPQKDKILPKLNQKTKEEKYRKKLPDTRTSSHDDDDSYYDSTEDTFPSLKGMMKKGNKEDERKSALQSAKSNKFQEEDNIKTRNNNELKEYHDSNAHASHNINKRFHESLTLIKTRKTREVLSIEPTPLTDTRYPSYFPNFIKSDKQWLIGIAGLLTITSLIIGIYYILPKRSTVKPMCSNISPDDDFVKIDVPSSRNDSEICATNDEMKQISSDDVISNFINIVLNRCENSETENLTKQYSANQHLSRIHLACTGITE